MPVVLKYCIISVVTFHYPSWEVRVLVECISATKFLFIVAVVVYFINSPVENLDHFKGVMLVFFTW